MRQFERHYTVEEARRELPAMRARFARVQALLGVLEEANLQMQQIETLLASNGHAVKMPEIGDHLAELQGIVAEIAELGVEVKDLQRGLIDFPHIRDGEEVLLCWLYGEEDITAWHTIEGGFGGRQPL